jgi:cell wall assembly regulator SMI1
MEAGVSGGMEINPAARLPQLMANPMPSVAESWDRVNRWLAVHAPKLLASLNPGASASALQDAEQTFGFGMPDDWRELYGAHDGMNDETNLGGLFFGMEFLSLSRVTSDYVERADYLKDEPLALRVADRGIRTDDLRNPRWITLAYDGSGTWLRVDLDPAAAGQRGQLIFVDDSNGVAILLGASLREFFESFAHDLEQGRYSLDADALKDGNEFLLPAPEIDVVNWFRSSRWNHLKR